MKWPGKSVRSLLIRVLIRSGKISHENSPTINRMNKGLPSDTNEMAANQTRGLNLQFDQKSSHQYTMSQTEETNREARRSSARVTTQERNAVERINSPPIKIRDEEHLPHFYDTSNNYLDVLRKIKVKNQKLLRESVHDQQSNQRVPAKKVIAVDLRKHQMQFAKSSKGGDVTIPSSYVPKQPDYVIDNIGSTTNSRIMEENDIVMGYDYPERARNNSSKQTSAKMEQSVKQTKKKVQVQVDRLSQKLMRQV